MLCGLTNKGKKRVGTNSNWYCHFAAKFTPQIVIGLVGNHPDLPPDNNQKISSTGLREREWQKNQEAAKGKL